MDLPSLPGMSWQQALGGLASVVGAMAVGWWKGRGDELNRALREAEYQRQGAQAAGDVHSMAFWGREVQRLRARKKRLWGILGGFLGILAVIPLAGCASAPPTRPVMMLSERVKVLAPGDVLPPTFPPAARWYCIDDVALTQDWGILSAPLTPADVEALTNAPPQTEQGTGTPPCP